jgi:predicted nucleic acid-binding protein
VRRAVKQAAGEDLFISVITTGEIAKGIALLNDSSKKRALSIWLQALERDYADCAPVIDLETSHLWGDLTAAAQKTDKIITGGRGPGAATARRHGLYVMTRNTEHFEAAGVGLVNP